MNTYSRPMKKNSLLPLLCLIALFEASGQSTAAKRLSWNVNKLEDLNTNKNSDYKCTFVTNGFTDIKWSQGNGDYITQFEVKDITGSWSDVSATGKVVCQVKSDEFNGEITFERTSQNVFITLYLDQPKGRSIHHRYSVSSIRPNN